VHSFEEAAVFLPAMAAALWALAATYSNREAIRLALIAERFRRREGALFELRMFPRDVWDIVSGLALIPWVLGVFFALPILAVYLLGGAVLLAFLIGGAVLMGVACAIIAPGVQRIWIDADGLTLGRYAGPMKVVRWSELRSVRRASRMEVYRRVHLWPGIPPRGSAAAGSTRDQYLLVWTGGSYYFAPNDPQAFETAITQWSAGKVVVGS
jgi:hypothetical protein